MCFVLVFLVLMLFNYGCASMVPVKPIIFVNDYFEMTANDTNWLSGNIDTIFKKLANDGMSFCMVKKIYSSYVSYDYERNKLKITVKPTLETLLEQLQAFPSYSVIFVVTNATKPSNDTPIDNILEEIQNKQTQVNFLIGTETPFSDNDSLQDYKLIASVSNGFVMGPEIFQFDKFADEIYLRLTRQPQVVRLFSILESYSDMKFCAETESFFTTALADLKYTDCGAEEYEKNPGKPRRSTITNVIEKDDGAETINEETLVKKCSLENPVDPTWVNYIGFTENDYDFDYGFTIVEDVVSLDDTYRRPMNGMTNKIYVSLTDKNFEHGVDHFKILLLNETQFGENIAVEQIQGTDLFVGSFDPPKNEYFYIEVTSYVNQQTTVSRISSTALSAAEGFGNDHDNRIFEHRPMFKRQTKSYDNIDIYLFIIGVLLATLVIIKGFKCSKQDKNKKPQKVDKDYRAVSNA
ncbi:uncharacterized protein LOC135837618 [Planococcus citri]|uniref:uncharacterized protein LOC135837618 n=1 Tax=Planococcus citri TaxID=170843 RepID=UPI0031F9F869